MVHSQAQPRWMLMLCKSRTNTRRPRLVTVQCCCHHSGITWLAKLSLFFSQLHKYSKLSLLPLACTCRLIAGLCCSSSRAATTVISSHATCTKSAHSQHSATASNTCRCSVTSCTAAASLIAKFPAGNHRVGFDQLGCPTGFNASRSHTAKGQSIHHQWHSFWLFLQQDPPSG